jgi:O-antigen/teichoic acid export membrane protein
MLSFLLLPLYTGVLATAGYGEVQVLFAWFAIFNVLLAYGMETAFFRFFNGDDSQEKVVSTSLISILCTTGIFVAIAFIFQNNMAHIIDIPVKYVRYAIYILAFDALVIIPFAWLRANEKPMRYAIIKILNVAVNLGLNIFFLLLLPKIVAENPDSAFSWMYKPNYEISYIFIAMLIASGLTLILMSKLYVRSTYIFDKDLWKRMIKYAWPVLVAGMAFAINEVFNKIMLDEMLPEAIAKSEVGKFGACLKLALFMTLFATAFRMGIEPFFFSHAKTDKPQKAYAQITNYFVILGSVILLAVVVFADIIKELLVRNTDYWEAMGIVPIVLLASFCLGIYHNLSVWYKVTDRTIFGAYISIVGAVITIAINYLFIPEIGYYASAIAMLGAYGTMMSLSYFYGRKFYPIPYNMRKILFYSGLSILFAAISFYVFDRNLLLGSALLLLFLGVVYKMEHKALRKIFLKRS